MSRIVLHAGPEKCGSTSIQKTILGRGAELGSLMAGVKLKPREISQLNCDKPAPEAKALFRDLIQKVQRANPGKVVVLTHEMLFKVSQALTNLAAIAQEHADEVVVIAYIRRQSDFLTSAYGQWLFRAPARIEEVTNVLHANNVDPSLFWGIERHLIASILGGWEIGRQLSGHLYFDWSESVRERRDALAALDIPLSIGLLPRKGFETPLIPDFLARAGLDPKLGETVADTRNTAWNPNLTEAVLNAIEAGFKMPRPHQANEFFINATLTKGLSKTPDVRFVSRLKMHIDTTFEAKNTDLARELGLTPEYFEPKRRISGERIREIIADEAAIRAAVPVDVRQREVAARATLAQIAWHAFRSGRKKRGLKAKITSA